MTTKRRVYLDNAASTPIDSTVLKKMQPYFSERAGNASSLHSWGQEAKDALNESRRVIADSINAEPGELIFTSGGTESNNIAIKSIAFTNKNKGKHIITTRIEHDCVLNACKWLSKNGFDVTYLDVDAEGFVGLKTLEKAIRPDTILVSIIHGNNEIGTVQDLAAIGKLCKKRKIYFHTDACQSYTKVPIDVRKMNIDLMTINAHKIYGPKGVGALYVKRGTKMNPWQHGGGHEFGHRSGTENVVGVVGFSASAQLDRPFPSHQRARQSGGGKQTEVQRQRALQSYMIKRIKKEIEQASLNGPAPGPKRLCNNINMTFKYIEGEALLTLLDDAGIAVSTASACGVNTLEPSHVLMAIGRSHADANSTIRMAVGRTTSKADADYVIDELKKAVAKLRKISPFGRK